MIEENLLSVAKSIERLVIQAEKQQQLLKCLEGIAKEKSTIFGGVEEWSSRGSTIESIIEGGCMTLKEIKIEGKMNKSEGDENSNDRSKFKKVEMPVFSGSDLDSWLLELIATSKSINGGIMRS
ncbi:histone-lysine N-methyltransferase ASHR1 isoform X3 [Cucumis melo var. makuwa]|uniref:Histone-lysine N-methyltransferase ASHR1 isoform X3 n=1 Tax=Cucumis melo var. makuwa TaxID=1194695 RepID=A0A5A7UL99_CUCMM|nr:histone-lysine N-methyltransferase ASHR1 isoform X3 [Cucumis melo var. makuwa]